MSSGHVSNYKKPDVPYYIPSTLLPDVEDLILSPLVQDYMFKPGNPESILRFHGPHSVYLREVWCPNASCEQKTWWVIIWMPFYEEDMMQIWPTYWQWGQTPNRTAYMNNLALVSKDRLCYAARKYSTDTRKCASIWKNLMSAVKNCLQEWQSSPQSIYMTGIQDRGNI